MPERDERIDSFPMAGGFTANRMMSGGYAIFMPNGRRLYSNDKENVRIFAAALTASSGPGDVPVELVELSRKATPGRWFWQTSNSWLRLGTDARGSDKNGTPYGQDGYVAYPYVSGGDGHPDLCIRNEDDRDLIVAAVNDLRARIAARPTLTAATQDDATRDPQESVSRAVPEEPGRGAAASATPGSFEAGSVELAEVEQHIRSYAETADKRDRLKSHLAAFPNTHYARDDLVEVEAKLARDLIAIRKLAHARQSASDPGAGTVPERATIRLSYVNHEDRFAIRTLLPTGRMVFTSNKWHPHETWLIEATDAERPDQEPRLYALSGFLRGIARETLRASPQPPTDTAGAAADRREEIRNAALEEAASWHDQQVEGGHCGEDTTEIIVRQRRNRHHENAAENIRALKTPPQPQATAEQDEGGRS